MKKLLIILLLLACLPGLTGCDPVTKSLDGDKLLSTTVKIELVYYENTNPKLIRADSRWKAPRFDFSKVTPIATLAETRYEEFLRELEKNEMPLFNRTLNEPIGKTLILYQNDGSMIVLYGCVYEEKDGSKKYYGDCNIFDENGKFVKYLGDVSSRYVEELEAVFFENSTEAEPTQ